MPRLGTPTRSTCSVVLVAGVALLAACSVPEREDGHPAGEPADVTVTPTMVPTGPDGVVRPVSLQSGRALRVRVDVTQAPLAMRSADGTGREGVEIDIVRELARRWGVPLEFQDAPGGGTPGELGAAGPDLAIGGIVVRTATARTASVTMVPVLRGDVAWAVRRGNPDHLSPISLCGRSVAVESTSLIRTTVVAPYERTCQDQGNPMRVQTYGGQDQVTAALVAGKVDVMVGSGPAVEFAVNAAPEHLEFLAPEDREQHIGVAVRQDDDSFPAAVQATLADMERDGTLRDILEKWKLADRDLTGPGATASAAAVHTAAPTSTS